MPRKSTKRNQYDKYISKENYISKEKWNKGLLGYEADILNIEGGIYHGSKRNKR